MPFKNLEWLATVILFEENVFLKRSTCIIVRQLSIVLRYNKLVFKSCVETNIAIY